MQRTNSLLISALNVFVLFACYVSGNHKLALKLVHGVDELANRPALKNLDHNHTLIASFYQNQHHKLNLKTLPTHIWTDQDNLQALNIDKSFSISLGAAKSILQSKKTNKNEANSSPNLNILEQYQVPSAYCPFNSFQPRCDHFYPYRMIDGSCNNMDRPWWGMSRSPFKRLLHSVYADGLNEPRTHSFTNKPLPNPRYIALSLHEPINTNTDITNLLPHFNEFLHYDLGLISPSQDEFGRQLRCACNSLDSKCINILIPFGDQVNQDQSCMPMARSSSTFRQTSCNLSAREQLNMVTHWLDLSQLYGTTVRKSNTLRTFHGGQLNSSHVQGMKHAYLPFTQNWDHRCSNIDLNKPCFNTGDVRSNQNIVVLSFHTVWLREHNRVASTLAAINPEWRDEMLFQEARRITIAEYQHVVYNEYLPHVLGEYVASLYNLTPSKKHGEYFAHYTAKLNPAVINEFTTAAFRFDQTMIPNQFTKANIDFKPIGRTSIQNIMFKTSNVFRKGGIDSYIRGTLVDEAQTFDSHVNDYLNNHYFETKTKGRFSVKSRFSLPAINVNRGRDHGIAGYNFYRSLCGLNSAHGFSDLWNMPIATQRRLASVYDHVNDVDLFTGGTSEYPIQGGVVGPTFACIIAKQFRDLKYADRFYYENGQYRQTRFSADQLTQIRKVKLARVLCDNVEMNSVQSNPFQKSHFQINSLVDCASLESLDLNAWSRYGSTGIGKNFNK